MKKFEMGNGMNCKKKADKEKIEKKKTDEKLFNRAKTVRAEEIMRKSAWFIEKEEVDNYFSREELIYYKKHQLSKQFSELLIPTIPAEIK